MKTLPEPVRRAGWNRTAALALLALATGVAGSWLEPGPAANALARYGTSLVHGVGVAGGILLGVRWLQPGLDELDLRIRLEAYRFGFLAAFFGLYVYGELVEAGLPAVDLSQAAVYMFFAFAAGVALARRRYS